MDSPASSSVPPVLQNQKPKRPKKGMNFIMHTRIFFHRLPIFESNEPYHL